MNSEKSKTSNSYNSLFRVTNKIDLQRTKKYVALPNLSIFYIRKNNIRTIYLKYQLQHGMGCSNRVIKVEFQVTVLRSRLCDYSNPCILVKENINVFGQRVIDAAIAANRNNNQVISKL